MKLVLVNVGISGGYRGFIFTDRSFVFVPLDSKSGWCELMPVYEELWVKDFTFSKYAKSPKFRNSSIADLIPSLRGRRSHNDPDFKHLTYGHVKRGFGYETLLKSLSEDDILLHYATLDYYHLETESRDKSINPNWGAYIVGAFSVDNVYTLDEFQNLPLRKQQRFKHNPHYYCNNPADLWVSGKRKEYGLFRRAVPLSSSHSSMECLPLLSENFVSVTGKPAGSAGWYRAALKCEVEAKTIFDKIAIMGDVPLIAG